MRDMSPLRVFVLSRIALWALAALTLLAFESKLNPARGRWDSDRLHELGPLVDVWARWDSEWYLRIAEHGYTWPSSTPAFPPLYPLVVGVAGRVLGGHYLLAGVLVSLAAAAVAFVLLHRLARAHLGDDASGRAVLYLALFPTSLFLGAVYAESLLLALALGAFLCAERGRLGWAGILAGLAALTRVQGLALVLPLALFAWRDVRRGRALVSGVLVPLLLFALYPIVLAVQIGRPLAFLEAQREGWERELSPLGPLGGLVEAITERELVELGFAALMLPLAVVAWRRLGAPYGLYALVALALPMSVPSQRLGGLYSFPRLALAAFPCFLALAVLGRNRRVHVTVVAVLATCLAVFVVRWSLWYWVA